MSDPRAHLDIYDAIDADLAKSRTSRKQMAMTLWPGRRPETASSVFCRAMTADNTDTHLCVEHLLAIIKHTGGDHVIAYLCDFAQYERPEKKTDDRVRDEMRRAMETLMVQIREIGKQLDMEKL